jgi:predicted DNA-binding protein with PD1-like motif
MIEARGEREIVVRMVDGEDLVAGLLSVAVEGAVILGGIGMVRDARLAYWNGSEYEEHAVSEPTELLAMQGNIAVLEGERIAHCHVTVARRDGSVTGGHLVSATVANTTEIVLGLPSGIVLERRLDANGLAGLYPRT